MTRLIKLIILVAIAISLICIPIYIIFGLDYMSIFLSTAFILLMIMTISSYWYGNKIMLAEGMKNIVLISFIIIFNLLASYFWWSDIIFYVLLSIFIINSYVNSKILDEAFNLYLYKRGYKDFIEKRRKRK